MSFCVSKIHQTLRFTDLGGYETRNPSTMWCIRKADETYKWKDFNEIRIHTGDAETTQDEYTYSKKDTYRRLVPDFNFHAWPQVGILDYEQFVKDIDQAGLTPYTIHKVGWIGNKNTHVMRSRLLDIGQKNADLFDIIDMSWSPSNNMRLNSSKYISTPDLAKTYSMLLDIEGCGYSGRLKHLLWSHRPVLLVDRPHKEFFFEWLHEWEHYIPVKRDLSDLVEKTKWCVEHYDEALRIAENAFQFSKRYLTRDACYAQWNTILNV